MSTVWRQSSIVGLSSLCRLLQIITVCSKLRKVIWKTWLERKYLSQYLQPATWRRFVDSRPYLFWFQLFHVYHTDYWRGKTKLVLRCYLIRLWKILCKSKHHRGAWNSALMNLMIERKALAFKEGWVCLVFTDCRPSQGIFQFTFSQTTLD